MFDIITFGSATWDIFLRLKKFSVQEEPAWGWHIVKDKKFITSKGICFNSGSKVNVEDIYFSSGGGGTNTAATFSKQGFKVAYCATVGDDISGSEIIEELRRLRIDARFVFKTNLKPTNHSVILNSGSRTDRTILVYRGASELLGKKDIPWEKLKAKWFYLAPLSGKLCKITEDIINFAYKNEIKIAFNPGNSQLSLPSKTLKRILKKVDILILNQEEASLLTKIPFFYEKEIFKKINKLCSGIAIMTKGSKGVVVSDGKYLYRADILKIKVIDGTGAGDSFGAGFVSGFIRTKKNIEKAIQLATANANSCLTEWGAKKGLLKKNKKFKRIKVQRK